MGCPHAGCTVVDSVRQHVVANGILSNPMIMVDVNLQKLVRENPHSQALVKDVRACKAARATLQRFHRLAPRFFEGFASMDENLQSLASQARATLGMDHILAELADNKPTDPAAIGPFCKTMLADLRRYGCVVPDFVVEHLAGLQAVASDSALAQTSAATAAAPDGGEDEAPSGAEGAGSSRPSRSRARSKAGTRRRQKSS